MCALGVDGPLARFEPPRGCYLGAFVEHDSAVLGDFATFERLVGRKHACYVTYSGYGQPFPAEWVGRVKAVGAAAHIGWEPNDGLDKVRDDEYLRGWARAARRSGVPIFLRFASEMNGNWMPYSGDPGLFIEKWRLVWRVFREEAPNVAMVWCVFATPRRTIPLYYPGDDYVDWVGVNIYSVVYHNNDPRQPAKHEDPRDDLRYVYSLYADRKPIMVAEYAATSWCRVVGGPTVDFALQKMTTFYRSLPVEFPRVRCVQWFSWDTIGGGAADNNYSLTNHPLILGRYRDLISGNYWRSEVLVEPGLLLPPGEPSHDRPPGGLPPLPPLPPPDGAEPVRAPEGTRPMPEHPEEDPELLRPQRSEFGLRGVRPEQVVVRPVELEVYCPLDWEVRFIAFMVDGRVIHATNRRPFRYTWDPVGLAPGRHELTVRIHRPGAEPVTSPPLAVEVRRSP